MTDGAKMARAANKIEHFMTGTDENFARKQRLLYTFHIKKLYRLMHAIYKATFKNGCSKQVCGYITRQFSQI